MIRLILLRITLLMACLFSSQLFANDLDLADAPLYTVQDVPPMMMLVMGRDHTLFYEAYNDAADLDNDGDLDIKFKPSISYEGYFDPDKCYSYANNLFTPEREADTCTVSGEWSGNFLNYATMSRMDLLRKVLYGGYRSTDNAASASDGEPADGNTVLERAYIPQDAHSWAKSYTSETVDGYDIADYTPYTTDDSTIFFGTATFDGADQEPSLRVIKEAEDHVTADGDWGVWSWASTERTVLHRGSHNNYYDDEYTLRVVVCNSALLEDNCKKYTNDSGYNYYKPTGLLHDYGEDNNMLFGLITGSFNGNTSGGVLRKAISNFSDELDLKTGKFSNISGIVATINKLTVHGFSYSEHAYQTNCGWIATRAVVEGECASWGNPVGEMLYESLRYFSGVGEESSSFDKAGDYDTSLGLTTAAWDDPYSGREYCAQATNLLISDINPSYDSDQLPGAYSSFSSTYNGSTIGSFDLASLLTTISGDTSFTSGNKYFIGQSTDDADNANDGAPTAKQVDNLGHIRGIAPAEPTKQGSFSSAGVAYYGMVNDLRSDLKSTQNVTTSVVSLASSLPQVEATVDGKTVKIIPFAKTVGSNGSASTFSRFQPTNTIVDWYVESIDKNEDGDTVGGVFRINFEDVEQGADHDMDMIVKYSYVVQDCSTSGVTCASGYSGERLAITLESTYAAGGYDQHAGYVISGTTHDDLYLEVRDVKDGNKEGNEDYYVKYYLDTPDSTLYSVRSSSNNDYLPLTTTRYFYPSTTNAASFLDSPLLFAAKWGNFSDADDDNQPLDDDEWDADGDGLPDAYFPVTNTSELSDQLTSAFSSISATGNSSTSPVFSSTFLEKGTFVYTSSFESEYWSGDIKAFEVDDDGDFSSDATWSAADLLDARTSDSRTIFTRNADDVFEFTEANVPSEVWKVLNGTETSTTFSVEQLTLLLGDVTNRKKIYVKAIINYLRGTSAEDTYNNNYNLQSDDDDNNYVMRTRNSKLGDIINSTPYYVASSNGHDVAKDLLVFGANDGMVHLLDASTGSEVMAYIPSGVYGKLNALAQTTYSHKFSVDGGITAYSTDVVNSSTGLPVTTLVGTLGTGVAGLYAIDVSDMRTPNTSMMKWEITTSTSGYSGLGSTSATPTIAKLQLVDDEGENRVGVIFANGYNSNVSSGVIYIADVNDGSLIKTLDTGTLLSDDPTGLSRPNAMASPTVVDLDSDGVADRVYAGDLYGNMWAFDISDPDSDNWGNAIADSSSNPVPLFTAVSPTKYTEDTTDISALEGTYRPQSITSHASVGAHPYGVSNGVLVAFGTGKYVESMDNTVTDQATQSYYVIWDKLQGNQVATTRTSTSTADDIYTELLQQEIKYEVDYSGDTYRFLTENQVNWASDVGFYLDLINTNGGTNYTENYGERQVTDSLLSSSKVTFTTLIPDEDPCASGGKSWYMSLNIYTGQSWVNGQYRTEDDGSITVVEISSNQKLEGIATAATSAVSISTETTDSLSGTTSVESTTTEAIEKTCVTVSGGGIVCYDDDSAPTGRLTWQQLY